MQYSLLTEVWGQNYHENKNIINAGQDNSLDDVAKNVDSAVTGAQDEADDNKEQKLNTINAPNNPQPNKVVLIKPSDIQYGGGVIKNDNYILLGLLLLFIVDTFYNL
tara:strand:- start:479 stop:799 length:321 start_codon:yes stop_codon:yes gene_type:complete